MNFAEKEQDATAPDASVSCCDDHAGYVSVESGPAAFRVFTGAPTPEDFVSKRPQADDNIRVLGEDVAAGAVVLSPGTRIDARHIALLAAAGVPCVCVSRRVRVAVISTGNVVRGGLER